MDFLRGPTPSPSTSSTFRGGSTPNDKSQDKNKNMADKDHLLGEVLQVTKLRFSGEQLEALNYHLVQESATHEEGDQDFSTSQAASIVERLIQRLLCAVGNLDPRFSSKFLISLTDYVSNEENTTLEYIVRLDALSTPVLYPKDPIPSYEILEFDSEGVTPGFARIRLRNLTATNWAEFINSSGYLRRDKIQERFVELLALAAAGSWPNSPLDVDDSTLCAAPGKILDAATLHHVLHVPPEQHVFYGPASSCQRFPDPRDFRLAIVDESGGVRVRVGFLAPALAGHDVEVRLLVALGVDAWPSSADFPRRVHVAHAECLLYHEAKRTGMYLTALGQHSASWQIQMPAAEVTLVQHYAPSSAVLQVLAALYGVLKEVHSRVSEDKCKFHCKLLSRRVLRESLYHALESSSSSSSSPLSVMAEWTTAHVARHVVRTLDRLVGALRCQHLPGYFFPGENLLGNAGYAREEDYLVEANRLYMYMARLHSLPPSPIPTLPSLLLESSLASRYQSVTASLLPPASTRSCRFTSTSTQYTPRQLDYVAALLARLHARPGGEVPLVLDDVVGLVAGVVHQAGEVFFKEMVGAGRRKSWVKAKKRFDAASAKLGEHVRKEMKKSKAGDVWEDMALARLHSLPSSPSPTLPSLLLESSLASRYLVVTASQLPPASTRSCRFSTSASTQYTPRQLDYVAALLARLHARPGGEVHQVQDDVVGLVAGVVQQAGEVFFEEMVGAGRRKSWVKARVRFDAASAKLGEHVRKEMKKSKAGDVWDDMALVKSVLRYLYKAIDHSRHTLAPVLRPYLTRLFTASHELSWTWYLDQVKKREALEEMHALGMFSTVVNRGEKTPAAALIESVNKGWTWASTILALVSTSPLRVVFTPSRGKVLRHILSLPSYNQDSAAVSRTAGDVFRDRKNATLPARGAKAGVDGRNGDTVPRGRHHSLHPTHQDLKISSPMTETFSKSHRRGKHRCAGDLVEALAALNKISILQEVSHILPPDDRRVLLSTVQQLCREHKRQAAVRRRSTMPSSKKSAGRQLYTPTEDGAHQHQVLGERVGARAVEKGSLIGSCKAARIKEDSAIIIHENFKINALFKNDTP